MRGFYGENEKAVAWQIWTAMLTHLLLRYLAFCAKWPGNYTRFMGVVRAALWERTNLMGLLQTYGTPPPSPRRTWGEKNRVCSVSSNSAPAPWDNTAPEGRHPPAVKMG